MVTQPLHVFFCYAPQDEELCRGLEAHLSLLVRQGYLTSYASRRVGVGTDRRAEVDQQMDRADVILLLISADFLASDQLYDIELRRALERRAKRTEDVLGVLLRPCDWKHGDLASIDMHPRVGDGPDSPVMPVASWSSLDAAFMKVAEKLRERAHQRMGMISRNPPSAHLASAPFGWAVTRRNRFLGSAMFRSHQPRISRGG